IGEGEAVYDDLLDLYKTCGSRKEFLEKAALIPGIYVPSFYDVSYNDDFTIKAVTAKGNAPAAVKRVIAADLDAAPYPEDPIIPYTRTIQDRLVLEIQRGCIRGCRFCQAGMIYRPIRRRSPEKLKEIVDKMIAATGYEEITLSSLSSSDYPDLLEIINYLTEDHKEDKLNISLPSLRIDSFSLDIMSRIQDIRKVSLTFAPEAGSQRLRDVINKGIDHDEIISGASEAFNGGWSRVKLYFMFGLPTETDDDVRAISDLCNDIANVFYEIPKDKRPAPGRVEITCSTSFFVPKPFTPFQWARQNTSEEFLTKQHILRHAINESRNHRSIRYSWHDSDTTYMEGIFARGDRRLSRVIRRAYEKGCIYDAWNDQFRYDKWMEAFLEEGVDPDFYLRERSYDEILPWDHIDTGVSREFLIAEAERAKNGIVTPNCAEKCSACGCAAFRTGICTEKR
ncbi:MAG: TIGR03960 family B12-binding radical SAM protein, partial [Lachnospiraceae bacterium]|nr:TIGR03960 family B12-binding radical SAM protein [Lachnospiraceae bacterium]